MIDELAASLRKHGEALDKLMNRDDWRDLLSYLCSINSLLGEINSLLGESTRNLKPVDLVLLHKLGYPMFDTLWRQPVDTAKTMQQVLFERGWIEQAMYINTILALDKAQDE